MAIDFIFLVISAGCSGIIWISSTVLRSYREIEALREKDNERVRKLEDRVEGLFHELEIQKGKEELREIQTEHRINLFSQQIITMLDHINEKLATQEKSISALHSRLDKSNPKSDFS